ncbi:MAG: hypothetical protein XU10_C0011G0025 [Chloroflexi bacterium CSP1-4]|nr:MAG: hypothetical protein XU10_C0011G0025 [Chloroflexi bacterium CSP1-4]
MSPRCARRSNALVAVAALTIAACGSVVTTMPLPTPADAIGIFEQWALRGVAVHERTSGDPGCSDPSLDDNAIHVVVSMDAGGQRRDVYLFRFRNRVRWTDGAPAVDACQGEFEARSARVGGPVDRVDVSPYRAFGDGWSPELRAALESGLLVAAGDGGIPRGNDANLTPQPTTSGAP